MFKIRSHEGMISIKSKLWIMIQMPGKLKDLGDFFFKTMLL